MLALLPLVLLYACTVTLYALTRDDLGGTSAYWGYFVPVVAFISLITAWGNAYARGDSRLFYLIKQIIIWGAFIWVLMLLQKIGADTALGGQKATVAIVLMTALVSLLVGLYLDSKMFFYGAYLGLCGYLLADPSHSAVLAKIGETFKVVDAPNKPLTMMIAIAVVAFLVSAFLLMSTRGSVAAKRAS
ncbi:hypothetical protein CKO27_02490 [Thiocystis violacea]|nr:hypothetical protein [Thiocystis violacea]MBK1716529.1 hypothetical protein [Thiocystis violacea]